MFRDIRRNLTPGKLILLPLVAAAAAATATSSNAEGEDATDEGGGKVLTLTLRREPGEGLGVGIGFDEEGNVFVTEVREGTPAGRALLVELDQIVSINDEEADEQNVFDLLPKELNEFVFVVVRQAPGGGEEEGDDEGGEGEDHEALGLFDIVLDRNAGESLGMSLAFVTDGLLVGDVVEDSPAARCGMRELDLIMKINGVGIEEDAKLVKLLPRAETQFTFTIFRPDTEEGVEEGEDEDEDDLEA
mmetsp:Transcript_22056/g.49791  ORF Transcript_22056/g.49791 Transcript_22056/m.49791 type:complete len:246 (-) Transcript_22056:604-1341(-)